jgi:hypothetical protein
MLKGRTNKVILFIVVCCMPLVCGAAQAQPNSLPTVSLSDYEKYGPANCADRSTVLDVVHQGTPADQMIVVIARPGSGDVRPDLSRRRLRNVHAYLTQYLYPEGRRDPMTIGMVEGDRVEGLGRLEFYVGGRLVGVIKARPDSDVDFGDCYPPHDNFIRHGGYNPCWVKSHRIFYPCRDRYERRKHVRS